MKRNGKANNLLDPDEILADSFSTGGSADILERKLERPLGRTSSYFFLALIGLGFFYLSARAFSLEALRGDGFYDKSQENRFLVRRVFAPRGIFYDHLGKPLVENIPSFGLVFKKQEFLEKEGNLAALLKRLEKMLQKDDFFFRELGFPADYDSSRLPSRILLLSEIPFETLAEIAYEKEALPGVEIFENYRRRYSDPYAYSHVLGFIGKPSPEELSADSSLLPEEFIGKSGLEAYYDDKLRGKPGKKIAEIDSSGRESRIKFTEDPEEGGNLNLAIDGALQTLAYRMLETYTEGQKAGSAVVLDIHTGAVRALVSFPGFDSNKFGYSLTPQEFMRLRESALSPFFSRAISGEFPAGSTLKPIIGAAALEEGVIEPEKRIYDPGYIEIPNPYRPGESSRFLDWRAHGWVDFYSAIAQSANVYFYIVGGGYKGEKGLGIERIKKYASLFGLGSKLGIDIAGEKAGVVPDPQWKQLNEPNDPFWRVGDTYNVSIGQGGVKVTPLQVTAATAAIANGGRLMRPYLAQTEPQVIGGGMVSGEVLAKVREGMRRTVTDGTARLLNTVSVAVAAKTGTAQTAPGKMPHAWVTAFAPYDNPEIAITVMVEHAGEGATVAVPITREILQWYFSRSPAD